MQHDSGYPASWMSDIDRWLPKQTLAIVPTGAGVGVVRDAKFASFQLRRPAQPMFYVPLAQNVNYSGGVMTRVEFQSHFTGGQRPPDH